MKRKMVYTWIFSIAVLVGLVGLLSTSAQARLPYLGSQYLKNTSAAHFTWVCSSTVNWNYVCGANMTGLQRALYTQADKDLMNTAASNGYLRLPYILGHELSQTVIDNINSMNSAYDPGNTIWYIWDEPSPTQFNGVRDVINYLKTNRPLAPTLVNMTGTASTTDISNMMATCKPDILMFDYYPFDGTSGEHINDQWFVSLTNIRNQAATSNVPFMSWTQTCAGYGWRTPSESEMRMLTWSALTAGAKGIGNFFWDGPVSSWTNAIIWNGSPTSLYYNLNSTDYWHGFYHQMTWLRHLHSSMYRFIPGAGHSTPAGLTNWTYSPDYNTYLVSFTVNTSAPKADGLVGLFTDNVTGSQYFMLTNLNRGYNLTASQATANFTIEFDPNVTQVYRLNRIDGSVVTHTLDANHRLTIDIPGGTGELFCCDNPFSALGIFRGYIKINGDTSDTTTSRNVTLNLYGQLEASPWTYASQMRFWTPEAGWTAWESYASTKAWRLSAGSGYKYISVQYKIPDGRVSSPWGDDITLL